VGILAGISATFPRGVSASTSWSFLLAHEAYLLHACLGALAAVDASYLALRTVRTSQRWHRLLCWIGAVAGLTSVAAGLLYVTDAQADTWLTAMTSGWIAATMAFLALWAAASHAIRAESAAPGSSEPPGPPQLSSDQG